MQELQYGREVKVLIHVADHVLVCSSEDMIITVFDAVTLERKFENQLQVPDGLSCS